MESLSSYKSTTILLPAAGWGSRMGYPNAKEILLNPQTGQPFIQYALESVLGLDVHCVVITRSEKKDLLAWLTVYKKENPSVSIEPYFVTSTEEWPDTLLKTKSIWTDFNIVLLPDTDWKPKTMSLQLQQQLATSHAVYGVFNTTKKNWGFVKAESERLSIVEKPLNIPAGFQAWGLFGFRKEAGEEILQAHLQSTKDHEIKDISVATAIVRLEEFNDRTRGEQVV